MVCGESHSLSTLKEKRFFSSRRDKSGVKEKRFYKKPIEIADKRFDAHLKHLKEKRKAVREVQKKEKQ
jgi:hypothetical protein